MKADLVPRKLAQLASVPAAGANSGGVFQSGGHVFYDTGSAVVQLDQQVSSYYGIDTQAASATLTAADFANGYFRANFSAPGTVTVPPNSAVPCPVGFSMPVAWVGGLAGLVSIVPGAGVTLRNIGGASFASVGIARPGAIVSLTQVAANVWEFVGPTDCQPNGGIYRLASTVAINNTATETSLVPDPAAVVAYGFRKIKANVAVPGLQLLLIGGGLYTTPAMPSNSTLRIKLGSVTLSTVAITGLLAMGGNNLKFGLEVNLIYRSIGATGTVQVEGTMFFSTLAGGLVQMPVDTTAPVTVDTTVDSNIDVTFQWAAAQSGQLINVYSAMIQANQ